MLNQDLFAFFVAALLFVSGIAGLAYHAWGDPKDEAANKAVMSPPGELM